MAAPSWTKRFIEGLAESGNVTAACDLAGIPRCTAYARRKKDATFAATWDDALERACDSLEAEARRRAMTENSDTLLIFLLKAHRPEKFRDTVTHRGDATAPIKVILNVDTDKV